MTGYHAAGAVDVGRCCCGARIFIRAVLSIPPAEGSSYPNLYVGNSGTLTMCRYWNGTSADDLVLELDLANATPGVLGELIPDIFYWTVKYPLLLDGETVGSVTATYISGSPGNGDIDLDITIDSQRWKTSGWGYAYGAYVYGLAVEDHIDEVTEDSL